MSTLAAAITDRHWDLAAHVLILAALQTLNDEGPVLSLSKGGNRVRLVGLSQGGGDGKKKRVRKRQTKHLS